VNHQALSSFIWSVADLLRGDYKQSEYGRVILPFTVLRRLDCVLAPHRLPLNIGNSRGQVNGKPWSVPWYFAVAAPLERSVRPRPALPSRPNETELLYAPTCFAV